MRKSIHLSKHFRLKKSKMRLHVETRWSSQFYVLESVKKCFDKNAFVDDDQELKSPVSLNIIETYLKVFLPAYRLSLGFQFSNSTIGDTIPGILKVLHEWKTMNVNEVAKKLCNKLIENVEAKFEYDLNSVVYQVIKNRDKFLLN